MFFTSDHHFDHANILKFTGDDGQLIRPGFSSVEEMNELMIERWNSMVKPTDTVVYVGDFAFGQQAVTVPRFKRRLNGVMDLLTPGNHDDIAVAVKNWPRVKTWHSFRKHGFVVSHFPIRAENFEYKARCLVHGHIHQNVIADPRYINVSVERWDYRPVHIDQIAELVAKI